MTEQSFRGSAAADGWSGRRPWGEWRVLDAGPTFRVVRLEIDPHQRLSYQVHDHRAVHWVVLRGTAACTIDRESFVAGPGDHMDVPRGSAHRIANVDETSLVVVEVQRGDHLGEDDARPLDYRDVRRLEEDDHVPDRRGAVPVAGPA